MLSNPKQTKDAVVQWICNYFAENGQGCSAVVGISGGKDSAIVAALCVEALGRDRVFGVLMPNGVQMDISDSIKVVRALEIPNITVNIGGVYSKLVAEVGKNLNSGISAQAKVNLPPRLRMATLYTVAQSLPNGGRVANTCNMSEDYVGYSTKFGDSAGDFSPLANFMVHEVLQIGYELRLPKDLVDKTPADGLCGKTDEDNLGFTYAQLDDYIANGTCGAMVIDHAIQEMHRRNLHKLLPMPAFGTLAALTKYNVALTDANGEFRSTYDIVSDIAAKWDELSNMEQDALANAIAGVQHKDRIGRTRRIDDRS